MRQLSLRLLVTVQVASRALASRLQPMVPVVNVRVLAIVGGAVMTLQVALVVINTAMPHTPVLGLRLDGRLVGKMQRAGAERATAQAVRQRDYRTIRITAGTYKGTIAPRQLGAHGNWQRQYQYALRVGRSGNWLARLAVQDRAAVGLYTISLEKPQLNSSLVSAYVDTINRTMSSAPSNAYFDLQHDQVIIVPEKAGVSVNGKQATALLSAQTGITRQDTQNLELPLSKQAPTVSSSQLQALLPKAQAIAAKPLKITASQQEVMLSREQLISAMEIQVIHDPANHNSTVDVGFNEAKLNTKVDGLLSQAQSAPIPTIVGNGKVYRAGSSGLQGEDDHPVVHVLTALVERETNAAAPDTVALPMRRIDPPVVPLAALSPAEQTAIAHNPSGGVSNPAAPTSTTKNVGTVYLTIDDAPGQYTNDILDILKRYGVHATFYVIGRNAQRYPEQVKRIFAEGHTIGNHSYSHSDLSKIPVADIQNEIQTTQTIIKQLTGSTPVIFRPPYGAQSPVVQTTAAGLGLTTNMWSIDPQDWAQPGTKVITDRIISKASPGSVILLHVLHRQTVDALPSIIEGLRGQGYTIE